MYIFVLTNSKKTEFKQKMYPYYHLTEHRSTLKYYTNDYFTGS